MKNAIKIERRMNDDVWIEKATHDATEAIEASLLWNLKNNPPEKMNANDMQKEGVAFYALNDATLQMLNEVGKRVAKNLTENLW
jgi:hypothetical protein